MESDPTYLHFEVKVPFSEKQSAMLNFKHNGWRFEIVGETTYKDLEKFADIH